MLDDFITDPLGLRRGVSHVKVNTAGPQYRHFCRYLDTTGDGTGTIEATGNYAAAPVEFFVQPQAGQIVQITRLVVYVRDVGFMRANEWADQPALTNGVVIQHKDSSGILSDITNGRPLTTSPDLDAICATFRKTDYAGIEEALVGIIDFRENGAPIRLDGDLDSRLVVTLNDNFSGLTGQRFRALGFLEVP